MKIFHSPFKPWVSEIETRLQDTFVVLCCPFDEMKNPPTRTRVTAKTSHCATATFLETSCHAIAILGLTLKLKISDRKAEVLSVKVEKSGLKKGTFGKSRSIRNCAQQSL